MDSSMLPMDLNTEVKRPFAPDLIGLSIENPFHPKKRCRRSRGAGRKRAEMRAEREAMDGASWNKDSKSVGLHPIRPSNAGIPATNAPRPPPNRAERREGLQLITPSIAEMNARIRHYKEAAEEWEKKFHEKTNATIDMYKQESEWHRSRADRLAEQVKELETKLEAKSALDRQGIIRTFEFIGVAALKEKIAEVFTSEAVSKTIEAVFATPEPSTEYNIKCEVIEPEFDTGE